MGNVYLRENRNGRRSGRANQQPKQDIYSRVTNAIVSAIEAGAGAYKMPWVVRLNEDFSPITAAVDTADDKVAA